MCASGGFGAYYAGSLGAEHSLLLAGLSVAMALGLELAKPFSIAAAFDALRTWRLAEGTALALLGLVAVAYSLSAELSLMATMRGDRVAERAAASNVATNARDRDQRAKLELDGLPTARPSAELQAFIDGVLADPRAHGCATLDGPYTREHCPAVAEWKAEQARSERRAALEREVREAEQAIAAAPAPRIADPGAVALAAYLALFDLRVDPGLLTQMLVLVGVFALELGSALALLLVRAVPAAPQKEAALLLNTQPEPDTTVHVVHPQSADDAAAREKVKTAILKQLAARGGAVASSERGLAALLGASRPTLRRAITGLVVAGVIAAEASRNGTMLRLVS